MQAVRAGDLETVVTLLAAGAEPEAVHGGVDAVWWARRLGFEAAADRLAEAGG